MRSVAQGHRTATDLRQLEAELAVLRELSLGDAVKTRQLYDRLTAEKEAAIAQVRQQARMELEMCVAAARSDAQAEARTAIEQAMSEIAKVSASNDRLAAELGEIHEVKVRCQQLEAETAVKMDAVIHRETQALERLQQAESALADSLEEAARIRQLRDVPRITVEQLTEKLRTDEPPLLIDLRPQASAEAEPGIPSAVLMSLDELIRRHHELPRHRDVVLYCGCPNDVVSAQGTLLLHKRGFTRVWPLAGGIEAWRRYSGTGVGLDYGVGQAVILGMGM